jgi:hypothetical protein
MTATSAGATPARSWSASMRRPQVASALLVGLLAVVAILATLGLRAMTEGFATTITQGGVSAAAPAGWYVKPGAGELAFIVTDPRASDLEYVARVIDPFGVSVETVAKQQAEAKGALLTGYVPIDTTAVIVNGTPGVRVRYAYLATGPAGSMPRLVRGMDLYVPAGNTVLGLSYESPAATYEDGLDQFYRFVGSARVEAAS